MGLLHLSGNICHIGGYPAKLSFIRHADFLNQANLADNDLTIRQLEVGT